MPNVSNAAGMPVSDDRGRGGLAWLLLAVLAVAGVAVLYGPYLDERWSFAPYGDTIYLTGPLFCDISRTVKAGAAPLMNWSTFEAIDYNPHVAGYYPFYLFRWLTFCSATDAAQAADIIAVAHIAIFLITMTRLCRATGASLAASVVGAAICATFPNTFALAVFPTFIAVMAWLPVALEGLVRLFYHRGQSLIGALLLALGTGAMLTAGPGTNLLSALILAGMAMAADTAVRQFRVPDPAAIRWLAGGLAVAAVVTFFLTLASTVHLFSHLDEIIRWTRSGPVIGASGTGNPREILTEQLGWRDLVQLVVPVNADFAAGNYFLGPAAIALGVAGGWRRWAWPAVRIFFILALICLCLVFLSPSRVLQLWAYIPGLSHTRHLSLLATPLCVAVALLCAHGLDVVAEGRRQTGWQACLPAWGASALLGLAVSLPHLVVLRSVHAAWLITFLGGVAALSAVAAFRARPPAVRACATLGLLAAHGLLAFGSLPRVPGVPAVVNSPTWQSIEAAIEQIRTTDPEPGWIALHPSIKDGDLTYMTGGSAATYRDLPTFSHYTSPRVYWKFAHEISLVGGSRFAPFGGKYLLSAEPQDPSVGEQVFASGDIRTYRLKGSRPAVAMVCAVPEDIDPLPASTVRAPRGQLPLLAGTIAAKLATLQDGRHDCGTAGELKAARIDRAANALHFAVEAGPRRLAVINLPPYAAWKLELGGTSIPLYNLGERQIVGVIPANLSGRAELVYRPVLYGWLKSVTALSWVVGIVLFIGLAVRWRRRSRLERAW
ncbi:MAG: hypothetical protein J0H01_26305 [Rhizobiales bacterium]|nr:hypothetical protein [Hyphomicrobiales bacterium]